MTNPQIFAPKIFRGHNKNISHQKYLFGKTERAGGRKQPGGPGQRLALSPRAAQPSPAQPSSAQQFTASFKLISHS